MLRRFVTSLSFVMAAVGPMAAVIDPPAAIGRMLFADSRFSRPSASGGAASVSCSTCHGFPDRADADSHGHLFSDAAARSAVPPGRDGRKTTLRNSPALIDAVSDGRAGFLHWDGEFVAVGDLVEATFLGRNFGWLPDERDLAQRHLAEIIRTTRETPGHAAVGLDYAALFDGTSPAIPAALRLPPSRRLDVAQATDREIVRACAALVTDYLRTLRQARNEEQSLEGSPYDAFLAANRLSRAPRPQETDREYARRLAEQVGSLRSPIYVREGEARHFGAVELQGLRIFLRGAVGSNQTSGAGNCAECHVPPRFTDGRFHNTGVTQQEYDAVHGPGRFMTLRIPSLVEREADHDRWLPPTARHPRATGRLASPTLATDAQCADLGLWNVYANADMPAPQSALEALLNPDHARTADAVLASTVANFKTPTLRNIAASAPYLHTGGAASLADVVTLYRVTAEAARHGALRNPPPEFFAVQLGTEDTEPLVAFMQSLSGGIEDVDGRQK